MKVLFDTNVYVAEALIGAAAQRIVSTTIAAAWRVSTCETILDELKRVLVEELDFSRRDAAIICRRCEMRAKLVTPRPSKHRVPGDPNDDPILAAACDAGVDYLVTNDKLLLDLDPYEGVRIISMTDYYRLLQDEGLVD